MDAPALISFLSASVLLTLAPGPDILFVLAKSLAEGARAGFSVACGLVAGTFMHTALAAFGVSLLVRQSPALFGAVKWLGAAYLIFLGVRAWRHRGENPASGTPDRAGAAKRGNAFPRLWATGLLMATLNPKLIVFFLAFFPQFLPRDVADPRASLLLLGAIFSAQALAIFACVTVFAGRLSRALRERPAAARVLNAATALTLFAIAAGVLFAS